MKVITRTIWILSLISLFADIASEMLYPVMPVYLKSIGFSVLLIGILEGVAEATAGFSKGYFGKLSDALGKRIPFIRGGYLMSAISKPMMGIFIYPYWIFLSRTMDRMGKGLRTSARDAMLSDESTLENKGKVFGFHRSMDTFGAVIGPIGALIFLYFNPGSYRMMFFIAFIPGLIGVLLTLLLKEKEIPGTANITWDKKKSFFSFLLYWKSSTPEYKKITIGFFAFALINSSDIFLLLMIKMITGSDEKVILLYILYNLVYALSSFPMGIVADKIGFRKSFIIGLFIFAIVYSGMALKPDLIIIFALFFLYGIYASATESISKAWISNIADKKEVATAIGFYNGLNSICYLIASSLAGFLWYSFNPEMMFIFSSAGAVIIAIYFIMNKFNPTERLEVR